MERLILILRAMLHSNDVAVDKDKANELESDFAKTTAEDFLHQLWTEAEEYQKKNPSDEEVDKFIAGTGLVIGEFFKYKLAHPAKKDESPNSKP